MSFFVGGGGGSSSGGHGHGHGSRSGHSTPGYGASSGIARPGYARSSSSGIFSRAGSSSSYYKRRPRDGYISYLVSKLKRLIAGLWIYARRHPVKAFFAVVVPLISAGGALHSLLKQFGIRLPEAFDGTSRTYRSSGVGGYYGSRGYGSDYGSSYGRSGAQDTMGNLFRIAKAFM
ncbi:hypothetical protein AAFC00_003696 [Neodothiora populina]|uniref:Uncharacterized protein n=1 Tax=Neodothiora populina TaxID=2781224 RepID=A0ABR3PFJ1_9PEZI